uniref:Putative peritrophic membrane chitin binding protein n=1 Tax=Ixodes ricinus TaxID=34613 RepID=A0A6B0U7Q3_IXORI
MVGWGLAMCTILRFSFRPRAAKATCGRSQSYAGNRSRDLACTFVSLRFAAGRRRLPRSLCISSATGVSTVSSATGLKRALSGSEI